jgi:hypothetical protein
LPIDFATVIEIRVWWNASPYLFKYHGFPVALWEALNPDHKVIEHFNVYGKEDIRPVEVVGFDMQKIPNDNGNRPRTGRFEPVLGDLYSLMVAMSFGIVQLVIFLQKDC